MCNSDWFLEIIVHTESAFLITLITSPVTDFMLASTLLICSCFSSKAFSCFLRCSLEFSNSSLVRAIT